MQQALAFETPSARPRTPAAATAARNQLWFCAWLPQLALEASGPGEHARAIVEDRHGIYRVLLCCPQALAAGVLPGQSANAALALLPGLEIVERSPLGEQQALEALANWLEQFSSMVCMAGRDVLLLEIAGSMRLYGGLDSLRRQISAGLRQQGFSAALAIAATPLAATWLARAGRRVCIRDTGNLATALRTLPLACLDWPAATCEAMTAMGVKTLGDCLRLPREGFARRFGAQRLLELDRALGRLPDPRRSWRAPEKFCADYEMTEEQGDRELLLAVCRELLNSLEQFLLSRQLGTQRLKFSFFHLKSPATTLLLGGAEAERRAEYWFDLLRIRFERLGLPEPVIAVRLGSDRNQALPAMSGRLAFAGKPRTTALHCSMSQLAERLAARIGHQSVQSVALVEEHRPQRAWRLQSLLADTRLALSGICRKLQRPLWMLPEPEALPAEQGLPLHRGRLTLLEGPERLETGWWDSDGIARDYYTAVNASGVRLWVYRNRNPAATWYLHGLFG